MSIEYKRAAAAAALDEVSSGMLVGLGTGSTAREFVDLLAARVAQGLRVRCVPTSEFTARQAAAGGIPLTDLEADAELDVTIDGADEVGPGLTLIKGAGGALLREKIVAAASRRMVVIADHTKQVNELGRCPLPIEVIPFGVGATRRAVAAVMRQAGGEQRLVLRAGADGKPFHTDGGHLILDAFFGRISHPEALSGALLEIPGVVQHGLFIGLCRRAYIAGEQGVAIVDAEGAATG